MDITELSTQSGLVFEQCDSSNKGYLTLDDFLILREFLPMSDKDLTEIFHKLDRDKSMKLYRDEFEDGFQYFLNFAQETCRKRMASVSGNDRYQAYGLPEGVEEDDCFLETIEQTGVSGAFDEVGLIKDVWKQIQRENPAMLPGFERILTKVSVEIKKRKMECENIENAMKTQKMKQDEEIRHLYEEMENQINLERKKLQEEELAKDRQRREELEREIHEKDTDYQEILRKHEETMEKLRELQQQHSDTAHEKDRLARERDLLEHRLTDSDLTLRECRNYIESLKEKSQEDRQLRAKAAIDLSEGIALERESLIRQLDELRALNRKLKDDQDEKILSNQLLPGQETIGEILNIDNSINKKIVKLQLNLPTKLNSMTPEQRRGSILSSYFHTVMPKSSINYDSDIENDEVLSTPQVKRLKDGGLSKNPPSSLTSFEEDGDEITRFGGINSSSETKTSRMSPEGSILERTESNQKQQPQDSNVLPDALYKIVFIGDSSVGKSAIHHRYIHQKFDAGISSTIGVDFQIKKVDSGGQRIILQLWDTAGQEKFRSVTKQYFRKSDGVVMVYDATSIQSYMNVRNWLSYLEDEGLSNDFVVILLANKVDLLTKEERAKENNITTYRLVSALTGEGIDEAFTELINCLKILEKVSLENAVNFCPTNETNPKQKLCCR